MGTPNFAYKNRCIVVTDDDFEWGNVPETESIPQGYTGYPQSIIPTDFNFFNVVLTGGYYEHACIDYEEKDGDWKDLMGFSYYYEPQTKSEFFLDVMDFFNISEYRLRKLCNGIKRDNYEYDYQFVDALFETVGQWLMEQEEIKVNEYLDNLMNGYGYEEYVRTVLFSNGEAWYSPKKTVGREALLQAVAS